MYTIQTQSRGVVTPVAGERGAIRLLNGAQTHFLDLVLRATLTLGGAATAIRNRGSLAALYDFFGINEAGEDRWNVDARVLRAYAETLAPSALSATRQGVLTAGAVQLVEHIRVPFAHPFALDPKETAYLERDARQQFELFYRYNGDASRIVDGGAPVITNPSISVVQQFDRYETKRPLFIPTARSFVENIAGAGEREIVLRMSRYVRAIMIQQDTTGVGEVSDIISRWALRGDQRDIVGPELVSFADSVRRSEFEYGGAVGPAAAASNGSYLLLNFQHMGRLASVLNPRQDLNLRFVFDAAPSAAVGAGTSRIRITMFELEHDANTPDASGSAVVAPVGFRV